MSRTGTSVYTCALCGGRGHNRLTCGKGRKQRPPSARFLEGRKPREPEPVPMARVEQIETAPGCSSSWLVSW